MGRSCALRLANQPSTHSDPHFDVLIQRDKVQPMCGARTQTSVTPIPNIVAVSYTLLLVILMWTAPHQTARKAQSFSIESRATPQGNSSIHVDSAEPTGSNAEAIQSHRLSVHTSSWRAFIDPTHRSPHHCTQRRDLCGVFVSNVEKLPLVRGEQYGSRKQWTLKTGTRKGMQREQQKGSKPEAMATKIPSSASKP